jgi:hypothetical protein
MATIEATFKKWAFFQSSSHPSANPSYTGQHAQSDKTRQTGLEPVCSVLLVVRSSALERDRMLLRIEVNLVAAILREDVDDVDGVELGSLEDEPAVLRVNLTRGIEPAKSGVQGSSVALVKA